MSKTAIVTGGTRGIGLDITRALREEGYTVAATYQGNEEAAKSCETETGAKTYKFDVSDFEACESAVKTVQDDLGDIAVLINNAGITRDSMMHKMDAGKWLDVINTNLNSAFNMTRHVIGGMRNAGYGRIVNISSINGQKGQFGQTNYSAAKAGLIGFTKALALENAAKGVTVNAICPGYIETDMTSQMPQEVLDTIIKQIPAARMGQPSEIAAIVTFLASDKAAFITGSTITANGGQYMV